MRNTETVAQSFENAATRLQMSPTLRRDPRAVMLANSLNLRADQVRKGQEELDRAVALEKEQTE